MRPTLLEIKNLIDEFAQRIDAPKELLPTYGYPFDKGRTHIEVDDNGQIYYFPEERSRERYFLRDIDDLLYYVFTPVTLMMAMKYELPRRVAGQDTRRIWFVEQERLHGILDEKRKIRKQKEHKEVLIKYPFVD